MYRIGHSRLRVEIERALKNALYVEIDVKWIFQVVPLVLCIADAAIV